MSYLEKELIEPKLDGVSYESYLKTNELLTLQTRLSANQEHDEMLFIVIHQVYELWFKQLLHETEFACENLRKGDLMASLRTVQRINTIQQTLTAQVDILETMTPNDFARFRANLNPASGFQSFQFRYLEFRLGQKAPEYLKFHKHNPKNFNLLEQAMTSATVYDEVLRAFFWQGVKIPEVVARRDVTQMYQSNPGVVEAFVDIYRQPDKNYLAYMLLEALADLDERFLLWRYRHVAMVMRMIGFQRGTGGSSGVNYLSQTLTKKFFPEIWDARNFLGEAS